MSSMYANDDIETLHVAVSTGLSALVTHMLEKGVSVEAADYFNVRPIHIAAGQGYLDIVDILIAHGCDVNVQTACPIAPEQENDAQVNVAQLAPHHISLIICFSEDGDALPHQSNFGASPLHLAVQYGHLPVVQRLVLANANVNAEDNAKETPLAIAAAQYLEAIAIFLIQNGANVNASDVHGWTPLHWSATKGSVNVTQLLIQKQAEINASANGSTPLHVSLHGRHYAISRLLIASGADVNARDSVGRTALCLGANIGLTDGTASFMIAKGASVNERDTYKRTPLHYAAKNNLQVVVQILFHYKADVNATDCLQWTPLHYAANEGNSDVVKCLVDFGAKVNARNEKLATPLHLAADRWHYDVVTLLLARGADVNASDDISWRALHFAVDESSTRPSIRKLEAPLQDYKMSTVKALLENGAAVNAVGSTNETALHVSVKYGDTDVFKYLLNNGAYYTPSSYIWFNSILNNQKQFSMRVLIKATQKLFEAVEKADCGEIENCIKEGAVVNMISSQHLTPLVLACMRQHLSVVQILLANGADVNWSNSSGFTALHYAAFSRHHEILCTLLQHGAIYNARASRDITPLKFALQRGAVRVVHILEKIRFVFHKISIRDNTVLDELNTFQRLNYNLFLAIRNCKNEDKKTVIEIALENGYRFEQLRSLIGSSVE